MAPHLVLAFLAVAFGAPPIGAAIATSLANKSDRHPKLVSPRIDGFYFYGGLK
jgi:hypothetical protein